MLAEFLRESSIHGLRYLVEAKNPLARLLWVACVCTCAVGAAVVIYLNVVNWENSPSVVTTVRPELVKGKRVMPTVTVCPRQPDVGAGVLLGLFRASPSFADEDDFARAAAALAEKSVVDAQRARIINRILKIRIRPKFQACADAASDGSSAECDLVRTLCAARNAAPADAEDIVKEYLVSRILSQEQPELASLRAYVEERLGAEEELDLENSLDDFNLIYRDVMDLYLYFFPLYGPAGPDSSNRFEVQEELRPIEHYEMVPSTAALGKDDFGPSLAHLIDRRFFTSGANGVFDPSVEKLANLTKELFLRGLSTLLASDVNDDVLSSADALSYDPNSWSFFSAVVAVNEKYSFSYPCGSPTNATNRDELEYRCFTAERGSDCDRYCDGFIRESSDSEDKSSSVRKLYEMASAPFGPLLDGSPRSLLPVCKFPRRASASYDGCWRKVVTDRGICYASQADGSKSEVTGTGASNAFQFALDLGGSFHGDVVHGGLDVTVTPPNHFTTGRLDDDDSVFRLDSGSPFLRSRTAMDVALSVEHVAVATDDFRSMDPAKRNCYYARGEKPLRFFPSYSEPNCKLECAWKEAEEACGCVPWFLRAQDYFHHSATCELYGNACFRSVVDDRHDKTGPCYDACLPDCETVKYSIAMADDGADPVWAGQESWKVEDAYKNQLYYDYVMKNKSAALSEDVVKVLDSVSHQAEAFFNVGVMRVFVTKKTTLEITLTATVTAIDMISNVGGTLGLFCGVSLLSGVEILYWAGKILSRKRAKV